MENEVRNRRRLGNLRDQENANVFKGKSNAIMPNLTARGALGDLNTNAQVQRGITVGKKAVTTAKYEKKATLNRATFNSKYSHVCSKIDTGLAASKPTMQPSSRPPLQREELPTRAIARTKTQAALKETQQCKTNDENITKRRKQCLDTKKLSRLSLAAEEAVLKEPTESLGKLKLSESVVQVSVDKGYPTLPPDVEQIDAGDNQNPLFMSCYIKDIYHYLTELELKYPIEPDHMRKQSVINGKMRATLIDWLVDVQQEFCLLLETFHLAVGIIDRFIRAAHGTSENHHLAKYFVDLSLVEYSMAHYRPSELAAAALCVSLYLSSGKSLDEIWTPTMIYYSEYTLKHIAPIIQKISEIVVNVKNSKYKSIYNKYLGP